MRVLYILHAWNNLAGVENHTKALLEGLGDEFETAVVYPEKDSLRYLHSERLETFGGKEIGILAPFQESRAETSFFQICSQFRPDLIHFMHGFRWPLSIFEMVHMVQVPVILSSHDFYPLSPDFTGQNPLGPGDIDPFDLLSPEYSKKLFGTDFSLYLRQRRALIASSFGQAAVRTVPSNTLEDQLTSICSLPFTRVEYGVRDFSCVPAPQSDKLQVGYLGARLPQKGWPVMWEAIQRYLAANDDIEFHIFGGGETPPHIPRGAKFYGAYKPEDLSPLLSRVEVVFLPSVFRETFSIALSEVWQSGRVPAVSDIGALGERVIDGVTGKVFKPESVEAIVDTLSWFVQHNEWREWERPRPRTTAEVASQYSELYEQVARSGR